MPLHLRRHEGQWIEIRHEASGDTLHIQCVEITGTRSELVRPGATLVFDDPEHLFGIVREEAKVKRPKAR
jgi:hypothetical protein